MDKPDRYYLDYEDVQKVARMEAKYGRDGYDPVDVWVSEDAGNSLAAAKRLARVRATENGTTVAIRERVNLRETHPFGDFPHYMEWEWDTELILDYTPDLATGKGHWTDWTK